MNILCELVIHDLFYFFPIELCKSIWVSSRSHPKQIFSETNLKSPLENKNEIVKKLRVKDLFKKQ